METLLVEPSESSAGSARTGLYRAIKRCARSLVESGAGFDSYRGCEALVGLTTRPPSLLW